MNERLWRRDVFRVHRLSHVGVVVASAVVLMAGQPAAAQYSSDFEAPLYVGSADGIIITGQDKFYIPVADSQDGLVYTYAGNALGIPMNPSGGGKQFAGVTGGDVGLPVPFARAQRDIVYGDGTGVWTVSFDIAATYLGGLPSAQNLGSFSTSVYPDAATFIALARWTDPDTAANWNADYVWFNASGTELTESVNNPAFQDLDAEHWYRWSTTFNLDTNQIVKVSITDLITGTTFRNIPVDRYLAGGAAGGAPAPTGFRLFAGSPTAAGNTLAFDNVDIDLAGGDDGGPETCDRVIAKLEHGIAKLDRALGELTFIIDNPDLPPGERAQIINEVIRQIVDTIFQLEQAIAQIEAIQQAGGVGCPDGVDLDRVLDKLERAITELDGAVDNLNFILDNPDLPPEVLEHLVNVAIGLIEEAVAHLEEAIEQLEAPPPLCPWDLDGSGSVGASDLLALLFAFGPCDDCNDCPEDFDDNCVVGASDLLAMLFNWGPCP